MLAINIILILLNYLSLPLALFCDEHIFNIYIYDESRETYNFLQSAR